MSPQGSIELELVPEIILHERAFGNSPPLQIDIAKQ